MTRPEKDMTPNYSDLMDDIKQVLDISSRVDERAKLIQDTQKELTERINTFSHEFNMLSARVLVLESKNGGRLHEIQDDISDLKSRMDRIDVGGTEVFNRAINNIEKERQDIVDKLHDVIRRVQSIELSHEGSQSAINRYVHLFIQGLWVIIVCYVLYKLGLQTPPIP